MKSFVAITKGGLIPGYGQFKEGILAKTESDVSMNIPDNITFGEISVSYFDKKTLAEKYLSNICGSNWTYDFQEEPTSDFGIKSEIKTLVFEVEQIREQFDTILCRAGMHGSVKLNCYQVSNEEGLERARVEFSAKIDTIPCKPHIFNWVQENQTVDAFIREIKAYLFDELAAAQSRL